MEKIDTFVRSYFPPGMTLKRQFRIGMFDVCVARWRMQSDIRLEIVNGRYPTPFHMGSKKRAEESSTSSIYIVADDDCLPIGRNFVKDGVEILYDHPEYGLLTATSVSDGSYRQLEYPNEVAELHAVGGIAFVRKGILTDFNDLGVAKTDESICSEMNRKGYKTGVMPNVKFNHLGAGYSLTVPGCWEA